MALVAFGEVAAHLLTSVFLALSPVTGALADAVILATLLIPGIYFCSILPFVLEIDLLKMQRRHSQSRVQELASIVETTPEGILVTGLDGIILYVNPAWERITGWAAAEVVGKLTPRVLKSGRQGPKVYAELWSTIAAGRTFRVELTNRRKDGRLYVVDLIIAPLKNDAGNIFAFVAIERDVTERRNAAVELKKYADEIGDLYDNAPCGYHSLDPEGRVLRINNTELAWLGYTREEVLGRNFADFISEEGRARFRTGFPELKRTGVLRNLEGELLRKDGSVMPVLVNVSTLTDGEGNFVMDRAILMDYSELKCTREQNTRLEAQLRQAQKMEAVGRLAGGIAHDFNNLLTAISGYSQFLLESLGAGDPRRADVEEIKKTGDRATSLTRQLLAFSRRQVLQPKTLDMGAVALDMERMLHRLIGEDIRLRVLSDGEPAVVHADPGTLEQVIMNLAVNARDAMPCGGALTLEVGRTCLGEPLVHEHGIVPPGDFVSLSVADTGSGMGQEVRTHLFEPFFTTKERGKGTGLGLSTVYGIVAQSGGHLMVRSEPGRGTRFTVYLPRVAAVEASGETAAAPDAVPRGAATILVAEDEKQLRAMVKRILVREGFDVLDAEDGARALEICRRRKEPIHLMLTDVVMPRMSGPDLARRVAAVRPEIRVVFMSGYTDHAILADGVLGRDKPFIQKPFAPEVLVRKIREALAAPAPGSGRAG